jgi:predicted transcriptional regulator
MSQTDVLNVLIENKGKWMTAMQIEKEAKLSHSSTNQSLTRLRKTDFLEFRQEQKRYKTFYYKICEDKSEANQQNF